MGKTDPDADRHRQQSMILVPRDTPGRHRPARHDVFGYTDGAHGGHAEIDLRRRPGARRQPDRRRGRRLRDRPGPPRPRPHPPLHAADRHGRAGARADVPRGSPSGSRSAGRWPTQGVVQRLDRRVPGPHRAGPPAGAQDRLADGHRRQQGRAHRDPGHQDRRRRRWPSGSSTRRSRRTARPASARTPRWPTLWAHARTLRLADGPDEVHRSSLARRELRRWATG